MMRHPVVEQYLGAIFAIQGEEEPVIGARIAEFLGVSAPTVTENLQRLIKDGYLAFDNRHEVVFTDKGQELAETMARRHRIAERWLTGVLGLEWHEAHEEADKLEHALSAKVEERLFQLLGCPTTCPHGNPIPNSGFTPLPNTRPLSKVQEGDTIVIDRISERAELDNQLLQFLQRNGVIPGATFEAEEVAPFNGTITLRRREERVSIGIAAASTIWVSPIAG